MRLDGGMVDISSQTSTPALVFVQLFQKSNTTDIGFGTVNILNYSRTSGCDQLS